MRGRSCLTTSKEPSSRRRPGSSFGRGRLSRGGLIGSFWRSRDLAAYAAGVPTSCRRPGYFLLLAQEKVTKEKGPPESAPIGLKPDRYADGLRAFRRGSCPDEKCLASCQAPLRGLISTRPPPHTGPGRSRAASRRLVPLRGTSRRGRRGAPALEVVQNLRDNSGSLTVIPAKAGIQRLYSLREGLKTLDDQPLAVDEAPPAFAGMTVRRNVHTREI
ncbi:hypothetical protein BDW41_11867 [Dyella sp. AtDHG13]|nr:hypothetical protein BDW41_11867 [Dyella sp. AtDHG13]